jgi:hypothetical protein
MILFLLMLLQLSYQLYLTVRYPSNSIVNAIVLFFHITMVYFVLLTSYLLTLLVVSNVVTVINLPNKRKVKQCDPISEEMLPTG